MKKMKLDYYLFLFIVDIEVHLVPKGYQASLGSLEKQVMAMELWQ